MLTSMRLRYLVPLAVTALALGLTPAATADPGLRPVTATFRAP